MEEIEKFEKFKKMKNLCIYVFVCVRLSYYYFASEICRVVIFISYCIFPGIWGKGGL
jgi:hypothetical protein